MHLRRVIKVRGTQEDTAKYSTWGSAPQSDCRLHLISRGPRPKSVCGDCALSRCGLARASAQPLWLSEPTLLVFGEPVKRASHHRISHSLSFTYTALNVSFQHDDPTLTDAGRYPTRPRGHYRMNLHLQPCTRWIDLLRGVARASGSTMSARTTERIANLQ